MSALFAKEIEFWIWLSKDFWLDYDNPLFAPDYHIWNYSSTISPCSDIRVPEDRI